uniref:Presequence protease, mitochondrial n=1 Tax=Eptatretus burgeri TaxID=7764 RepID=A0A8C4NAH8_EPTBU
MYAVRVRHGGRALHRCFLTRLCSTLPAVQRALNYTEGSKIGGYTIQKVTSVPDLLLTAVKLKHEATSAQHLHLARNDPNNLFSVQFRTPAPDSTGVPHILEHLVLCGSERFTCRDPFFKMLSRSLATFMNAFTSSDFTMFPFSTQNPKDFQNLLSVYLDAVFFPRLQQLDFWQEGWRLEHMKTEDPTSPIVFKGVVFNEMKGAFSSREQLFCEHSQRALQPVGYGGSSGGDPIAIPDLSWQQLCAYHASHYHPSNARFLTYGDMPLDGHLKQIEDEVLSRFQRSSPPPVVASEPRWNRPHSIQITCPPDPLAPEPTKQEAACVSFLLSSITDSFESFTLSLLGSLLVSGPNAPFYQALIEAQIGSDFTPTIGYEGNTKDGVFSVGLQGLGEGDSATVVDVIDQVIAQVVESGFTDERVEALLHKMELGLKHQTTNFGLTLASAVASTWNHDGDPVEVLRVEDHVQRLRACLRDNPKYLQEKVAHYLQQNKHRLVLTMLPEAAFGERQLSAEAEKLQAKISSLGVDERAHLVQQGLHLQREQDKDDASCLPTLRTVDVQPKISPTIMHIKTTSGGVPVLCCDQPTNGVVYFRAFINSHTLTGEMKTLLPLFCSVLTKMGLASMDYRQLAQRMDLTTGDLNVTPCIQNDHSSLDAYEQGVLFSSMCLDKNVDKMMDLWKDIFTSSIFEDLDRLKTLLLMAAQELANGVTDCGHMYAMTRAARLLTPAGDIRENFEGLAQVSLMKRLSEYTDVNHLIGKLSRLQHQLLTSGNLRCSINSTPEKTEHALMAVDRFVASLPKSTPKQSPLVQATVLQKSLPCEDGNEKMIRHLLLQSWFRPCEMKTYFQLDVPVSFAAHCLRCVPFTDPDYASLQVLARLLGSKFLHREIREKGGAYGGAAKMTNGNFTFFSYRDPSPHNSLSTFERSKSWACSGKYNAQDVDEAKLSVFSAIDAPLAPSEKGQALFLSGISEEMRQKHREAVFSVNQDSLVDVATRYLEKGAQTSGVTIIGPQNKTLTRDPSWIVH